MIQKHVTTAGWVAANLYDPGLRIIDTRFLLTDPKKGRRDYDSGHIVGALYADLDQDLSGPITVGSGRHPLPGQKDFLTTLNTWGIGAHNQVVVYDDSNGAIGARLWWMLSHWLGHPATALLDGGYAGWQALGLPTESGIPEQPAPSSSRWKFNDDSWVSTEKVVRLLEDPSALLVDARNPERYRGEKEPIDRRAGHIPGAMNLPLGGNLGSDGCFRNKDTLRDRFGDVVGGREPGKIVHTCGSGVSACHNLLAMEIAGLEGSKLYVGSWSEWIADPTRSIAVDS